MIPMIAGQVFPISYIAILVISVVKIYFIFTQNGYITDRFSPVTHRQELFRGAEGGHVFPLLNSPLPIQFIPHRMRLEPSAMSPLLGRKQLKHRNLILHMDAVHAKWTRASPNPAKCCDCNNHLKRHFSRKI